MIKTYVASKSRHWPFWQALRSAGVNICSSWIDAEFNHTGKDDGLSADHWRRHWDTCIREAASADIVLVYAAAGEHHHGALFELGAGLASAGQVFLVTDDRWSIGHHPKARRFNTLADAVTAIMAMQAGERARLRAA